MEGRENYLFSFSDMYTKNKNKFKGNKHFKMFIAFYHATLWESSFDTSLSITTPSFVDIMVLSLLIEADRPIICFSKRISNNDR